MNQADLIQAARQHLARFPTTRRNLERVLKRKLQRATERGELEAGSAQGWIPNAVHKMERLGLLDDALFAKLRLDSLRAAGKSARMIKTKLIAQGVDAAEVDRLFESESNRSELDAARRYLQRRRLGPYARRSGDDRESSSCDRKLRQKALESLARAGFSYSVANRVLTDGDAGLNEAEPWEGSILERSDREALETGDGGQFADGVDEAI